MRCFCGLYELVGVEFDGGDDGDVDFYVYFDFYFDVDD